MDIQTRASSRPAIDTNAPAATVPGDVAAGQQAPAVRTIVHDYPRPPAEQLQDWKETVRSNPALRSRTQGSLLQAMKSSLTAMIGKLDRTSARLRFSPHERNWWKTHLDQACTLMRAIEPRQGKYPGMANKATQKTLRKLEEQVDDMRDRAVLIGKNSSRADIAAVAALSGALNDLMATVIAMHTFLQVLHPTPHPLTRPAPAPPGHARHGPSKA